MALPLDEWEHSLVHMYTVDSSKSHPQVGKKDLDQEGEVDVHPGKGDTKRAIPLVKK